MLFRHYIWDFDGTLYDTYPGMTKALCLALKDAGVYAREDEVLLWLKRSVSKAVAHYEQEFGLTGLLSSFRVHEESVQWDALPYAGMPALLQKLIRAGGRHYIYTHRGESTCRYLQKHGIDYLFADVVTSLHGFPSKPAPDAVRYLLLTHGISPADAVMVGDRDIDLLCGRNAGIAGCLFDPGHFYDNFEAPLCACNIAELTALFLPEGGA